jgi:hypothetical protein
LKTAKDFELTYPEWLVDGWLPLGHRIMDVAHAGSYKTTFGVGLGCHIATGKPIFGREVLQGPVVFIDEETPVSSLDNHINRFCLGLGTTYDKLYAKRLIIRTSKEGFRFGKRDKAFTDIINAIKKIKPVYVRMDSFAAMLPNGMKETDGNAGKVIQDNLTEILEVVDNQCSILLSVHTKKDYTKFTFEDAKNSVLEAIARGHGSIIAEGCDTGLVFFKISEHPDPARFAIINKARRGAIPATDKIMYVEVKEQEYGKGWERLELMAKAVIPPTQFAIALYPIFAEISQGGGPVQRTTEDIKKKANLLSNSECRIGLTELMDHKIILYGTRPMTVRLNPKDSEIDPEYLSLLKREKRL